MKLLSKKEFAKECGITTKDLANYIKRGKVVTVNDKEINPDVELNKYFIEKRKEFNRKKGKVTEPPTEEHKLNARSSEKNIPTTQPKFDFPADHNPSQTENFAIDTKIKKQELEKSSIQTELLKAKLQKLSGDSIPTELVRSLITNHSKSITIAFHNGADNLLMTIAQKKNIDRLEMAELRAQMVTIINTAINDSIEHSKKMVSHIVAEYSQKKEQGERE